MSIILAILFAATWGSISSTQEISSIEEISSLNQKLDRVVAFNTGNTNVWFSATNYYESVGVPCSLQLYEIRDGEKRLVWDQRKWTRYYADRAVEEGVAKALNRIVGDTTFVNTPKLALAGGMTWEKELVAEGSVFVLSGQGIEASTDESSFKLCDLGGEEIFTVKRTAAKTLGAVARSVSKDGNTLIVGYNVTSPNPPVAEVAQTLEDGGAHFYYEDDPDCPATVVWSGHSGAYVATVVPRYRGSQLFLMATYDKPGSNQFIFNLGEVKIAPKVENGAVTWEIVQ